MCVVRDELLLLSMLVVQCVAGLPVMALMKLCGVAYALLFVFGFGISVSVAFAPYLRWCCSSFKYFVNEFGICLFWMTHVALLSLSSYTLYIFLIPFVKSDNFMTFCVKHKLYSNLTRTGCDNLQGNPIFRCMFRTLLC
ncbi:hypothetical protein PINS_up005053 [Pythium insidiosum]|nr:hypothetical protein PINS_up005053 [Pythium insidiosum]